MHLECVCVCVCVLTLKVSEIWIVLEVSEYMHLYSLYMCVGVECGVCWYSVPTSSTAVMTLVRPAI